MKSDDGPGIETPELALVTAQRPRQFDGHGADGIGLAVRIDDAAFKERLVAIDADTFDELGRRDEVVVEQRGA